MDHMNKTVVTIIILTVILLGAGYFLAMTPKTEDMIPSPLNATYLIGGEPFTLINGSVEKEIVPGSAAKNKVSVFGDPAFGDVDGDGDDDAVVILANESGGSGTFYYAAIAVNSGGRYRGTDTVFLGDRIVPRTFYVEDNRAKITYADRAHDEPFSEEPSIERSVHLQFDPESLILIQVAVDFEGEAEPSRMTLDMHTWKWIKTVYNNDTELVPNKPEAFTLTFKNDGTFSATTDCNTMGGSYQVTENRITFGDMFTTLMFCEGSQEQEFSKMLGEAESYFFTNRGEMVFDLKFDSGSAIFR